MAKKPTPTPKIVNRKHVARLERERIQRQRLVIAASVIGAVVVLLIAYALINQYVLKPTSAIAEVDGEKISVTDFQARVRFSRQQSIQQWTQLQQMVQMFGEQGEQYFGSQISQIEQQLSDPDSFGNSVLDQMINEVVIRQEAEKLGITVSDEEIDAALQEAFGFFPDGTPTPAAEESPVPTSTLSALQMTLVPPTATATLSPTVEGATPEATATVAVTPTVDPAATATPTEAPLPTPTEYTLEGYQTQFGEFLTGMEEIQFDENNLRELIRAQVYQTKLYEEITADVSREQEQVWARHILVATLDEANAVLERLEAGEDFAAVAAEVSLDESNKAAGGDLQWFSSGDMVAPFDETVFAMTEIGQISEPVQTDFGYHIIQLLGKETRSLSAEDYETARQQVFGEYIEEAKAAKTIERQEDITDLVPMTPSLTGL